MTEKEPIVFLYAQDSHEGWWGWYCPWCKEYNIIGDGLESKDAGHECQALHCKFGRKKNITFKDLVPVSPVSWIEETWRSWHDDSLSLYYFHFKKNPTITK